MAVSYSGRLGEVIKMYPKVQCFECDTFQVQIISYLEGDPEYKCRHCKHKFSLPFKEEQL